MRHIHSRFLLSFILSTSVVSLAFAHDFWAGAKDGAEGKPIIVQIGYGHSFPELEPIDKERLSIFNAPTLIGKNGNVALKKSVIDYEYVSEKPLDKGSYIAVVTYKPTSWSTLADGSSKMDNKTNLKGVISCEHWTRFAKRIINIDSSDDFVTKPLGHALELIPLKNPNEAKVGEPFKIQVLFNGRPRVGAKVTGTFEKYSDNPSTKAFATVTDEKGQFDLIPLKNGNWFLMVEYSKPFEDETKCDTADYDASLAFNIQ